MLLAPAYFVPITLVDEEEDIEFKLSIWDFPGDLFYLNLIHHFLDKDALYILVFDLASYRTADFNKNFAHWLNYIVARNNHVSLHYFLVTPGLVKMGSL